MSVSSRSDSVGTPLSPLGNVSPDEILKQGHLLKQGHMFKNWKMRLFQLCKNNLTYGHLQKGVRGTIDLSDIRQIHPLVDKDGRSVMFEIKTINPKGKKKDFLLLCQDDKEREDWIHAIKKARDNKLAIAGMELFHDICGRHAETRIELQREFIALKAKVAAAKKEDVILDVFGKLHHFFNSVHNRSKKSERDAFERQFNLLRAHVRAANPSIWTNSVENHFSSVQSAARRESSSDYRGRRSVAGRGSTGSEDNDAFDPMMQTPLPPSVTGEKRKSVTLNKRKGTNSECVLTTSVAFKMLMVLQRRVKEPSEYTRRALSDSIVVTHGSYEFLQKIGEGTFACVYRSLKVGTTDLYAVKRVDKRKLNADDIAALRTEVDIMLKLNHPNIVRLYETFESKHFFDLVMEFCPGGELFERLVQRKSYPEPQARIVVRAICDAVAYCHRRNVVHRDLKPENILFADTSEDALIKVADFGFAQKVMTAGLATDCGSPWYVAPEILTGIRYESSVDMWSIGVITYILLCGYPPFRDNNQPRLFAKIRDVQYEFDSPYWDEISADAKNFVSSLLQGDPKDRLTAAQALQHEWLAGATEVKKGFDEAQAKLLDLVSLRLESVKKGNLEKKGAWNREYRSREFLLHPKMGLIYTDRFTQKGVIGWNSIKNVKNYTEKKGAKDRHARSFVVEAERSYTLRAESLEQKAEWMKAINDGLKFRKLVAQARVAINDKMFEKGLHYVDQARQVDGFFKNYVTTLQWASLLELCDDITTNDCAGISRTIEYRHIHSGPISCLSCSQRPDRRRIVLTGGHDKLVVLWDALSGDPIREMKGHATSVKSCAMSEVQTAVSGGSDGTLHAWDLETGKCLWFSRRRDGHKEAIAAVAITPDGDWAVSGSWDKLLTVWSMNQGRAVMRLMGHKRAITAVALTSDGRHAISGSVDTRIMVWDLQQQKRVRQFRKHDYPIRCIAIGHNVKGGPDDLIVVSGDDHGGLMAWNLHDGSLIATLLEADEGDDKVAINDVAISRKGRSLLIAGEDRKIRLFDMVSQKELTSTVLESVDQEISTLCCCGDGGLFVATHENRAELWNVDWVLEHKGKKYDGRA